MSETSERTALYRIWGDEDLLLYIGISKDFGRRWKQHAKRQPWWGEMRRLTVDQWYPSREEAEAAEIAAIKAEKPKHNKRHLVLPTQRRGPHKMPETSAPTLMPVRIPSWEGAPVHPLDKWMLPGHSMAELLLSNPARAEQVISGLPEEKRGQARMKIGIWRLYDKQCRAVRSVLQIIAELEQTEDRPEVIAMMRKAKASALRFLEIPCPCCGGEPPAGMTCQECNASGPAQQPRVRRIRSTAPSAQGAA